MATREAAPNWSSPSLGSAGSSSSPSIHSRYAVTSGPSIFSAASSGVGLSQFLHVKNQPFELPEGGVVVGVPFSVGGAVRGSFRGERPSSGAESAWHDSEDSSGDHPAWTLTPWPTANST